RLTVVCSALMCGIQPFPREIAEIDGQNRDANRREQEDTRMIAVVGHIVNGASPLRVEVCGEIEGKSDFGRQHGRRHYGMTFQKRVERRSRSEALDEHCDEKNT